MTRNQIAIQSRKCRNCNLWCKKAEKEKRNSNTIIYRIHSIEKIFYAEDIQNCDQKSLGRLGNNNAWSFLPSERCPACCVSSDTATVQFLIFKFPKCKEFHAAQPDSCDRCYLYLMTSGHNFGVLPISPTKNFIPPLFRLKLSFLRQYGINPARGGRKFFCRRNGG